MQLLLDSKKEYSKLTSINGPDVLSIGSAAVELISIDDSQLMKAWTWFIKWINYKHLKWRWWRNRLVRLPSPGRLLLSTTSCLHAPCSCSFTSVCRRDSNHGESTGLRAKLIAETHWYQGYRLIQLKTRNRNLIDRTANLWSNQWCHRHLTRHIKQPVDRWNQGAIAKTQNKSRGSA